MIGAVGSILGFLFGGRGGSSNVSDVIRTVGDLLNPSARERRTELDLIAGQLDINKQEAAHPSLFVAGWRPWIGWICGIAMFYHFLFVPLVGPFVEAWLGITLGQLAWQELSVVLMGMLGLGGMRSWEKHKGVHRDNLKQGRTKNEDLDEDEW